ncbi:hypothetical protein GCM10010112_68010 [Actinoplanes lobatus]|uniref:Uncharacterized protein n=1 Tax=Actinoplanes lobatus TaxID=113568 RepID=A0A7W7MG81_9ACTN|nr:hypothetical protein [Actinoplanes lobatus]MBB4749119.1 hypothetical protein [Actinoplanes lobatus]GGN86428.1 hypothetical protein GCM10010112_68010 [Actinoplanes lobatus]GIE42783.1 hypothetical protein Alo02nite_56810 [Actinoplanes lobatus]
MSEEQEQPRRRGRPATGVTPKRNVRIGETWEQGEGLAARQRLTMTAYVEEALRRHNAYVDRLLRKAEGG